MNITMHDVLTNVLPLVAIMGAILEGGRRLWTKFEARMDRGDTALLAQFATLSKDVKEHAENDTAQFSAVNEQLTVHSNRLSWLEGKAGVPLGSTPRERPLE